MIKSLSLARVAFSLDSSETSGPTLYISLITWSSFCGGVTMEERAQLDQNGYWMQLKVMEANLYDRGGN